MATVSKKSVAVVTKVKGLAACVRQLIPTEIEMTDMLITDKGVSLEDIKAHVTKDSVVLCDPPVIETAVKNDYPLTWVHSTWAGVEKTVAFVRENKIKPNFILTRTGAGFGELIGEYVIGHIIARERKFKNFYRNSMSRKWDRELIKFRPLSSLTIGILGMGNIGKEIARMCKAMGMTVWALSRGQQALCDYVDYSRNSSCPEHLGEVLSNSDYVCSILPSTPQTRDFLSGQVLESCKAKKSILINVGRGDVIDENSLIKALDEGWIGGAILDVFVEEPLPESSPLWSRDDVIVTPHCSGPSLPQTVAETFVTNYKLFTNGQKLHYQVDWETGY